MTRRCEKSSYWLVSRPDNQYHEDYRLHTPATEKQARKAYREDYNLLRLPRGAKFYPGVAQ